MTGIILVNMGGVSSKKDMLFFLFNMFNDKYIIPFPQPLRFLFALTISILQHRNSWRKYQNIGGSPIKETTQSIANELLRSLPSNHFTVKTAYLYTNKKELKNAIKDLQNSKHQKIYIIPLFPHKSTCTNGKISENIKNISLIYPNLDIQLKENLCQYNSFTSYWTKLISKHIKQNKLSNPILLFSAHAIPEHFVSKGDKYMHLVKKSATHIASALSLPFEISYQSKMGRTKWTNPTTYEKLQELSQKHIEDEIIIIPISFISENLETAIDIDKQIIPYAINSLNFNNISRVNIPKNNKLFAEVLKEVITHE